VPVDTRRRWPSGTRGEPEPEPETAAVRNDFPLPSAITGHMSGNPDEEELDELRQKKMEQLREQREGGGREEAVEAQREAAEQQKKAILRQYLTDGARKRLNSVKMSKPQFGEQVENRSSPSPRAGGSRGRSTRRR